MSDPSAPSPDDITPPPSPVRTITLVTWGVLLWGLVLVALALTPSLRTGERDWWFWVPVAGMVLGAIGYVYLRRGRGNAKFA